MLHGKFMTMFKVLLGLHEDIKIFVLGQHANF
jgi:hypothetical protein